MFAKATATIHLPNLCHNARLVRGITAGSKIMAVIKANAYGHGVHEVANALGSAGLADGFAVARFDEALELRQTQADKRILILGGVYTHQELDSCFQHRLDIVIHHEDQIELIERHHHAHNSKITAWLKMDSGMHRLGIAPELYPSAYKKLTKLPCLAKIIAMTHFANAEHKQNPHTEGQIRCFDSVLSQITSREDIESSYANSAGILNWKAAHGTWIRPGLMLYGISPLQESGSLELRPVMTLQAPVISLRTVKAGEYVGYNLRWHAPRDSVIATVSLGYADGYPTQIRSGTPVLIDGQRVPIVGRVSMDLITVDCTDLSSVNPGDTVTFWGEDDRGNHLPVEEIAGQAGTIPYDLVSKIGGRVKYHYVHAHK